tara:strand:- start:400 stop:786 length:387 start_codon:yes stop_codon:yes gene_type:complete
MKLQEIIWEQIILGEAASKANSRRLVSVGGKPRFIKSKKALEYSKGFAQQLKPPAECITHDVQVSIVMWYRTRRPDLDPALVFDLLQPLVIKNDRQIKVIHAYHGLDKETPRVWIRVLKILDDFTLPF